MKEFIGSLLALALMLGAGYVKLVASDDDDEKQPKTATKTAPAAKETNGVINLSADAITANHVQSVEIRQGSAYVTTRVPGHIEFNPNATAAIHSPLEGQLSKWLVGIGDKVHKGDVLGHIDSPQNLSAPLPLKAAIDGEIIERNQAQGAWVQPADKLAVITDPSTMWATAQVREDLVGKILTNAPVAIRVLSLPDETFAGRFLGIGASVDSETRTVEFRFAVPNDASKLRAGMFAYVSLATDRVEDKLLVPEEAVQTVHEKSVVFVEEKAGQYHMVAVQLGRALGETYEVLDGLSNGARVVTTGSFILKSEALRAELTGEGD
jgi:multidrug efflux pump subunit AcrA (membrane-fusion protein)